jgi:hypothetical protein
MSVRSVAVDEIKDDLSVILVAFDNYPLELPGGSVSNDEALRLTGYEAESQ